MKNFIDKIYGKDKFLVEIIVLVLVAIGAYLVGFYAGEIVIWMT